VTAGTM